MSRRRLREPLRLENHAGKRRARADVAVPCEGCGHLILGAGGSCCGSYYHQHARWIDHHRFVHGAHLTLLNDYAEIIRPRPAR